MHAKLQKFDPKYMCVFGYLAKVRPYSIRMAMKIPKNNHDISSYWEEKYYMVSF